MVEDNARVEEEQNLQRCLSRIDEIISEDLRLLNRSKEDGPVFGEAARTIRRTKEEEIRNLHIVRSSPYFGRVDFIRDTAPDSTATYYFGKYHIPLDYVFNWQAPAAKLFYQPMGGGYDAPACRVCGKVELKRELLIEDARLLEVTERRLLPPGTARVRSAAEQPSLTRELAKPKAEGLREIVATIQPHQYEVIAAAPQRVMIIQGVAGSGKSEIGLHRIAYLLSPHNELNLSIVPNRVAFFGPSKAFLRYVANLLPGLGVERVRQMTIRDWLLNTLSTGVKLEGKDGLLEKLLADSRNRLDTELRVARWKVSLEMAGLLERHVTSMRKSFITNAPALLRGHRVALSRSKVKAILRGVSRQPLNEQRSVALSRLQEEIERRVLTKSDGFLKSTLEAQFDVFWPKVGYRQVYVDLLSNPEALLAASGGTLTAEEAHRIGISTLGNGKVFRTEDLPALCYLDHLLNDRIHIDKRGRQQPTFEHVVVDEAQDVSPLEYRLLYLHSSNKSFTLVGDTRQGLLPHRGISDWREVKRVFAKEKAYREDVNIGFRATHEITKYANRVLKTIAPRMARAIPYERHGEKPKFVRSGSYAEMVAAIAEDLRTIQDQGVQTVALLCKTTREASRLQKELRAKGVEKAVLQDKPGYNRTEIAISPIHLAKGLEYDAVILANGRRNVYTGSVLDNRLLYVAVTRAAHRLHIHWFGALADALVDPVLLPKRKKRARRKTGYRNSPAKAV